eukprot:3460307-Rhodomonas_salina.1
MVSAVEDHLLELHKQVINKWGEAAFPVGIKDYGSIHKEHLCTILFHSDITKILGRYVLKEINEWLVKPWLMPVVQI